MTDKTNAPISEFRCVGSEPPGTRLRQQRPWIFDEAAKVSEEAGTGSAVDHLMVERENQRRHVTGRDRFTLDHRGPAHPAHTQDCALRWVEDRREPIHAKAAEIGDGKRATGKVVGRQRSRPGAIREFSDIARNLYQADGVGASNDRYDQASLNVDGDTQVDVAILVYRAVDQRCVEPGGGGGGGDFNASAVAFSTKSLIVGVTP